MPFDIELIEAKLAHGMIDPGEMRALAWDALEAGLDGKSIRRLAAMDHPSGWEADRILPSFMAEARIEGISREGGGLNTHRQATCAPNPL